MNKDTIISFSKPKSVESEAFRALRTNLEFSMAKENEKVILVTSSHIGEGKSTIAANLGAVFAMQNKKTILVDTDMRRGTQHEKFSISNNNGLSNFLANVNFKKEKFIKHSKIDNLDVITAGVVPPNPAELLSLDLMDELLNELKNKYDIIILDGAPVLPVTDSVILARKVDKILVVASSGETKKAELSSVKTAIESIGAKITGIIVNKVNTKDRHYSHYSSYYTYESKTETSNKTKNPKICNKK